MRLDTPCRMEDRRTSSSDEWSSTPRDEEMMRALYPIYFFGNGDLSRILSIIVIFIARDFFFFFHVCRIRKENMYLIEFTIFCVPRNFNLRVIYFIYFYWFLCLLYFRFISIMFISCIFILPIKNASCISDCNLRISFT